MKEVYKEMLRISYSRFICTRLVKQDTNAVHAQRLIVYSVISAALFNLSDRSYVSAPDKRVNVMKALWVLMFTLKNRIKTGIVEFRLMEEPTAVSRWTESK